MTSPPSTAADRLRGEIRAEMARSKITRQALADASGIRLHNLDRRLNGQVAITFAEAEQIARGLGIDYADLIARTTTAGAA